MTSAIVSLIILALIAFWCIRTVNDFKKKEIRVQEGISGTMVGDMVEENGKFTLENCTYIAPEGYKFKTWAIGSVNGEQKQPGEQITITAETYIYAIWEAVEYNVTVTGGTASVGAGTPITKATMGTIVTLTANAAPEGKVFDKWEVVSGSITLADVSNATTTFTMPKGDVEIKATYKDEPGSDFTYGDLNGDGKINLLDLIAMRKYLAKWNIEIDTEAADCNADGKINLMDLILLRKYLAKWSVSFGPQK